MKNTINLIVKDVEKAQRVDQFLSNKEKDPVSYTHLTLPTKA